MNTEKKSKWWGAEDLRRELATPFKRDESNRFNSVEDLIKAYAPPVTLANSGRGDNQRMGASDWGGYTTYYESLTEHAAELGQFPLTAFVGYGVLQNIAQNGMIRTCIQTVAEDMVREWITITGGENSEPELINQLQDLVDVKYRLRRLFGRAFATTGYFGGSFIFVRTQAEGEDLRNPLNISEQSGEIMKDAPLEFVLVDPVTTSALRYNASDPLRADYMKPQAWSVMGQEVHASRLLTIVDNPPPVLLRPAYNFLGIPQAQILWDYVLHWNKARETGVGILEKLNFLVYKTDFNMTLEAGGVSALDAKMLAISRYRNNNSVYAIDKEDDVINIQATISGVVDIIRQALEFIASINRTPAVKLLGISPSGFNATGESDLRNYYDHIRTRQETHREVIQKCLEIIQLAEFGKIDKSITFEFNELGKADEAAEAMTASTKVNTISTLMDRNVVTAEEVRDIVRQDKTIGLDSLRAELPEELSESEETDLFTDTPADNSNMQAFLANKQEEDQKQQAAINANAGSNNVQKP